MERKRWKRADVLKMYLRESWSRSTARPRIAEMIAHAFLKFHVIQSLSWCSYRDPNDALEKHAGISASSHFATKEASHPCFDSDSSRGVTVRYTSPCLHLQHTTDVTSGGGTGGSWWTELTRVLDVNEQLASRDTGQKRKILKLFGFSFFFGRTEN